MFEHLHRASSYGGHHGTWKQWHCAAQVTALSRHRSIAAKAQMGSPAWKQPYPPGFQDIGVSVLRGPWLILSNAERMRLDESPDAAFYATPRLMQHADQELVNALQGMYTKLLGPSSEVLELCASRHSHLPNDLQLSRLVGQGMNTIELAANPSLSSWFVQDLNQQPLLEEQRDASYDAVLCVNGVQYLTQPETVIAQAFQLLRPGGFLLIAFGTHFFPEKAIAGWSSRNMKSRTELVSRMLKATGFNPVSVVSSAMSGEAGAAHTTQGAEFRVLIASKPTVSPSSAIAAASTGSNPGARSATDMQADNVADWFTKPGLAGLTLQVLESTSAACSATDSPPKQAAAATPDVSSAFSDERLLEQWKASYMVLVSDAVALGIPQSVIPKLQPNASRENIQSAVQHLQAMVASFVSSGL